MIRKSRRGMTLVELMLSVGILAVIAVAAGSAMMAATKSYANTTKMQNDEYNARLALLAITRELHRGMTDVVYTDSGSGYCELELTPVSGEPVTYKLSDGELTRSGDSPVTFVAVELKSFSVDADDTRRVKISIECVNGMRLETVVALTRVPTAPVVVEGGDGE